MYECMQAEARVLILGRTSWHYDEVRRGLRPQRARRRLGGARVLARKLRVEPCPTFGRRAPRHGCQPCLRGSRLTSRVPSALTPSSPALAAHTLDQDSPASGNVSRAGDDCGVVVLKRRWHDHRPASQTGQGGGCSRSARNRRSPPLPRPEQRRAEGSPVSRGRRDRCSASKTRGPGQDRCSRRPAPRRPPRAPPIRG